MLTKKRIFIGLGIIFLLLVVAAGFLLLKTLGNEGKLSGPVEKAVTGGNLSEAEKAGRELSNGQCQGKEKGKLGTSPMKSEDFSMVLPYGLMIGGHVTPIDHQYFSPTVFNSPRDTYEVRAMADSNIVDIQPRVRPEGTEYRFVFTISCTFFYYYDLVTSLAPEVKKAYDESSSGQIKKSLNMAVKEGQLIGRIGGQTLDFAVWDTEKPLKGFAIPEHYKGESWKIYTADPLDYYTDRLKKLILSKYVRAAAPVSGKIDYDIDGKLIGNWFRQETGGYSGGGSGGDYYKNHLAIAPDAYDPASIVFSIGDFAGQPQQFGVKGNSPDPKNVSVATGLVKYELVQQDWMVVSTGEHWDRFSLVKGLKAKNHEESVQGVALLQLLENRKLKVEVFPGKTASQVVAFTKKAVVYER